LKALRACKAFFRQGHWLLFFINSLSPGLPGMIAIWILYSQSFFPEQHTESRFLLYTSMATDTFFIENGFNLCIEVYLDLGKTKTVITATATNRAETKNSFFERKNFISQSSF
jgi:hypothetical protein